MYLYVWVCGYVYVWMWSGCVGIDKCLWSVSAPLFARGASGCKHGWPRLVPRVH